MAPTSSPSSHVVQNSATSMHLWWGPPESARGSPRAITVDLEVLKLPTVNKLYFWALQASFTNEDGSEQSGGAHIGLQFHPSIPGNRGANWGGYAKEGGVLDGSKLAIPSSLGCKNTGDFNWVAGRKYRLSIGPYVVPGTRVKEGHGFSNSTGGWPGTITDLETGDELVLRRLYAPGPVLSGAVMWSEVFASCTDPSAGVRWSRMRYVYEDGSSSPVEIVSVNYQKCGCDKNCTITNAFVDASGGVQQVTRTPRITPQGTQLRCDPGS